MARGLSLRASVNYPHRGIPHFGQSVNSPKNNHFPITIHLPIIPVIPIIFNQSDLFPSCPIIFQSCLPWPRLGEASAAARQARSGRTVQLKGRGGPRAIQRYGAAPSSPSLETKCKCRRSAVPSLALYPDTVCVCDRACVYI